MGKIIILAKDFKSFLSLSISSYAMLELISLYSFDFLDWIKYDTLKSLAVIAPIIYYMYIFLRDFSSRKARKENEAIERENKEIEQDILIKRKRREEAQLQRIEFENRLLEKRIKEQENTGT